MSSVRGGCRCCRCCCCCRCTRPETSIESLPTPVGVSLCQSEARREIDPDHLFSVGPNSSFSVGTKSLTLCLSLGWVLSDLFRDCRLQCWFPIETCHKQTKVAVGHPKIPSLATGLGLSHSYQWLCTTSPTKRPCAISFEHRSDPFHCVFM